MGFKKVVSRAFGLIFEYNTVQVVSLNDKKIGLMCRFVQLAVISYVIGYVIIYKKGYQKTDVGVNGILSKVKGVSFTNNSDRLIWDVADYVVPPQENNAFFITTNAVITRNQTQAKCAENYDIIEARCKSDSDCIPLEPVLLGDGVKTGKCLNNHTCEIYAWCPVENSNKTEPLPMLKNVYNFTVFVKNNIEFRIFNKSTSNIPLDFNKKTLSLCRYHHKNQPRCPVFLIGTILDYTSSIYDDIASKGGVIAFNIDWNCDLDYSVVHCFPTYSFKRLDAEKSDLSNGWNFRYANYYYVNGTQYRDLIKAYGIRFIISVSSKAGKFDIMPLTMNLGSGIALLGLATLICDFVMLYIVRNRKTYVDAKYHRIIGEDAYHPMESDVESNNS